MKAAPAIHRFREHFHPLQFVRRAQFVTARKTGEEIRVEPATTQLISTFRALAKWGAIVAMVVGYHVLIGWLFGIQVLKSPGPTYSPMTLNEAICALLAGWTLLRLQKQPVESFRQRIGV